MRILFTILLILTPSIPLFAQQTGDGTILSGLHTMKIFLGSGDSLLLLQHHTIIKGSEVLFLDSTSRLSPDRDYSLQAEPSAVLLSRHLLQKISGDAARHSITISYRYINLPLKRSYALREASIIPDSATLVRRVIESQRSPFSMNEYFGSELKKSGTIFRGFTVGTNRDLSLNSGFRMQLSGKLSKELNVVAALTDENSPLQPEGTTQTLRELDKVFIELSARQQKVVLGDFTYQIDQKTGGEFGRLQRKLQGANGLINFSDPFGAGSSLAVSVVGATSRGSYTSNQLSGIDGNQGPYRLTSPEGNRMIIIIAGSERVYLNGELLKRGETQDYVIDYAMAEVSFTPKQLITSVSRITIDFEYSDRQYARNIVGASLAAGFFGERLTITNSLLQEADDPDSPIEMTLDDEMKQRIQESGSDRYAASFSGIRFAGIDSVTHLPLGQYELSDTLINGRKRQIVRYAPGSREAFYSVTFTFVASIHPDSIGYLRKSLGHYEVAGPGKGNYLPIVLLPVPELHRIISGRIHALPAEEVEVAAEYAFSVNDNNRLSSLDDGQSRGGAYKFSLQYHPKAIRLGSIDLGEAEFRLNQRRVDQQFITLDRMDEVEFERKWNTLKSGNASQDLRELEAAYSPLRSTRFEFGIGSFSSGDDNHSQRMRVSAFYRDSLSRSALYTIEKTRSTYGSDFASGWLRQRAELKGSFWKLKPALMVEMERREQTRTATAELDQTSFGFKEFTSVVHYEEKGPWSGSIEYQFRFQDSVLAGCLENAFQALTQRYQVQLREWHSLSSSLTLTGRRTSFPQQFRDRGNGDASILLTRMQTRYAPLQRAIDVDLYYEFGNQKSARLERAFIRVPKGTGNYRYRGDLNNNTLADEDEYELVRFDGEYLTVLLPAEQLIPVADLKTGFRIRLQPRRMMPESAALLETILRSLSSETVLRIDERSSDPESDHIALLKFNRFQNSVTTLAGTTLFTQDIHIFENDPDLSIRLRFNERTGLLQLVNGPERSYVKEQSLRIRSQLVKEIGNQTEVIHKIDRLSGTSNLSRLRDLSSDQLTTEFSYRPQSDWEIAYTMGVSQSTDSRDRTITTASSNEESLRLTYAIVSQGQLRAEITREEVTLDHQGIQTEREYSFEFTNGRAIGKSLLWQLSFDYRLNSSVQLSLSYHGRSEGGRPPIQNARAEARAFF